MTNVPTHINAFVVEFMDYVYATKKIHLNDFYESFLGQKYANIDYNTAMACAAESCGITIAEIKGKTRDRNVVNARRLFAVYSRHNGMTLKRIGMFLGDRDHSSILHLLQSHEDLSTYEAGYRRLFKSFEDLVLIRQKDYERI